MPRIEEGKEVLSWQIWDSITLGATDVHCTLFTTPVGQGGKTLLQTNMRESGRFPWPEEFTFETIWFLMRPAAVVSDVLATMNGYIKFIIGNKSYLTLRLWEMPDGGGLFTTYQITPTLVEGAPNTFALGAAAAKAGVPDQRAVRPITIPLTLEPGESFRVEVYWPTAPNLKIFSIGFDGTLRRSIQ